MKSRITFHTQLENTLMDTKMSNFNSYCTYLYCLRSIDMNQSNLRVDRLPNVTAVWVNYFLKKHKQVSKQINSE